MPQFVFIAGLPQSPIVYSPYAADNNLKSAGDLALGLERAKDVLYNMYRTGHLSEKEYKEYKDYDLTKNFKPSESSEKSCQGIIRTNKRPSNVILLGKFN